MVPTSSKLTDLGHQLAPEIATIGFATKAASLPNPPFHYLTWKKGNISLWYWDTWRRRLSYRPIPIIKSRK